MAYTTPLTPAAAAGNAIPIDHVNQLLANTDWLNSDKPWPSYAPTWTNGTIGNGTLTGEYIQFGKLVVFKIGLVWGSTTSTSGVSSFSLPLTAATATGSPIFAVGGLRDASAGHDWMLRAKYSTTTTIVPIYGDGAAASGVTATLPFTWATSDELHLLGAYKVP